MAAQTKTQRQGTGLDPGQLEQVVDQIGLRRRRHGAVVELVVTQTGLTIPG